MPIVNVGSNKESTIFFDNVYTSGEPGHFQKVAVDRLDSNKRGILGSNTNSYAIFNGGYAGGSIVAYNDSLTKTTTSVNTTSGSLSGKSASTRVTNYALFGGYTFGGAKNTIDAVNNSLTLTNKTLSAAKWGLAATRIGNYALFAGGYGSRLFNTVDAFNNSLTMSNATVLSSAKMLMGGASNVSYAIFTGGDSEYLQSPVRTSDAYNSSLTKTTISQLSSSKDCISGARVGNYALFAGGKDAESASINTVEVYDNSLTRSICTSLRFSAYSISGVSNYNYNYALFGGGARANALVDSYDSSLIKHLQPDLSSYNKSLAGSASIGKYILFAGGDNGSTSGTDVVDGYGLIGIIFKINIPPFSKYKFTESSEQATLIDSVEKEYTSDSSTFSGYIKLNANNHLSGNLSL